MDEERKKKFKRNITITIIGIMILSIIAIIIRPTPTTEEPILNKSKLYMEMEYYYYDVAQLLEYAGTQGVGMDEEVTEEILQECINVGYCEIILKEGLPITD